MPRYEYKVVPAPTKGLKAKGIRTPEARFSNAIQHLMNTLAEKGWEYQRAETLPSVERSGLASSTTEWRNVLVFRRLREDDVEAFSPELLPAPSEATLAEDAAKEDAPVAAQDDVPSDVKAEEKPAEPATESAKDQADNGVEDTGDVEKPSASLAALAESRKSEESDA